jgi:hypothetical protein
MDDYQRLFPNQEIHADSVFLANTIMDVIDGLTSFLNSNRMRDGVIRGAVNRVNDDNYNMNDLEEVYFTMMARLTENITNKVNTISERLFEFNFMRYNPPPADQN